MGRRVRGQRIRRSVVAQRKVVQRVMLLQVSNKQEARSLTLRHGLQSKRLRNGRRRPLKSQQWRLMKQEEQRWNYMILGHLVICAQSESDYLLTMKSLLTPLLQQTIICFMWLGLETLMSRCQMVCCQQRFNCAMHCTPWIWASQWF